LERIRWRRGVERWILCLAEEPKNNSFIFHPSDTPVQLRRTHLGKWCCWRSSLKLIIGNLFREGLHLLLTSFLISKKLFLRTTQKDSKNLAFHRTFIAKINHSSFYVYYKIVDPRSKHHRIHRSKHCHLGQIWKRIIQLGRGKWKIHLNFSTLSSFCFT